MNNNKVTIETLKFDNLILRELPLDPIEYDNTCREVKNAFFSLVRPTAVINPKIVIYSKNAMEQLLDLDENELNRHDAASYFSGNKMIPGCQTAAHCYCGHQFGVFKGQLGDGASMYIGEVINQKGERWEIQFKGAGQTPYSRGDDGRKVLRSSLREFLGSEAMFYLDIPTNRAGTCIVSDTLVKRRILYEGEWEDEKCSVILRIAKSFLRIGSFEIFSSLPVNEKVPLASGIHAPSYGRKDLLIKLLDYTCDNLFRDVYLSKIKTTYLNKIFLI
jgi:serine/tyrosine/threonine adenylyltransferase